MLKSHENNVDGNGNPWQRFGIGLPILPILSICPIYTNRSLNESFKMCRRWSQIGTLWNKSWYSQRYFIERPMLRQGSGANEGFWMVVTVRQVQGHVLSEVPDNWYMLYLCNQIWNNKGKSRSSNQFDDHDIYSHQSSHQVKYWDNVMSFQTSVQHYIAKWRSCCWEPWLWWWRCYRQASSGLRL